MLLVSWERQALVLGAKTPPVLAAVGMLIGHPQSTKRAGTVLCILFRVLDAQVDADHRLTLYLQPVCPCEKSHSMHGDLALFVPFDIVASKHLFEALHKRVPLPALQHGDLT